MLLVRGELRRVAPCESRARWRGRGLRSCGSNENSFNLVERDFLGAAVVKLRRARAGMVRHLRRLFKRATVFQVGGDAGCAKGVVADMRDDAARFGAPLNHRIGVRLGQGIAGELAGRAAVGLKQQRLGLGRQPRAVDIFMQVGL